MPGPGRAAHRYTGKYEQSNEVRRDDRQKE